MKESGVDMDVVVWYGVLAPAATPREIVAKLADAIAKSAHSPDIRTRLHEQGAEPMGNTPEEFTRMLRSEVATWAAVVKASGAKVND